MTSAFQLWARSPSARACATSSSASSKPALEQRDEGVVHGDEPRLRGLAQLARDPRHLREVRPRARQVAELDARVGALLEPFEDALGLAGGGRDLDQLARELELARRVGGGVVAEDVALDARRRASPGRRSGARSRAPRGSARRGARRETARRAAGRRRAGRAAARAARCPPSPSRGERALEQRDEPLVVARARPRRTARRSRARRGELLGQVPALGELGGVAGTPPSARPCSPARARASPSASSSSQRAAGSPAARRARRARARTGAPPPRRRAARRGAVARAARVARAPCPRAAGAAATKWCASSARCGSGSAA